MAAQQLGASHGRPNDWLEEYYFLLACYGAYTGRFENLQQRERIGALISAGVAASRLSWPRNLAAGPRCLDGRDRSLDRMNPDLAAEECGHEPGDLLGGPGPENAFPSYHRPLELARALNRSGEEAKRTEALTLLEGLRQRYPHVLAIGQEFDSGADRVRSSTIGPSSC